VLRVEVLAHERAGDVARAQAGEELVRQLRVLLGARAGILAERFTVPCIDDPLH
jgi:hypothetical protein